MKPWLSSPPALVIGWVGFVIIMSSYAMVEPLLGPPYYQPEGTTTRTVTVGDHLQRSYRTHVPENIGDNPPVLFALHGAGMTPWAMEVMTGLQLNELARQHGFIVVYPRGQYFHWSLSNDSRKDRRYIEAIIEQLKQDLDGSPGTIRAVGLSNGGMMAYKLACQTEQIDGIAAVASYFPRFLQSDCPGARNTSLLVIHGTDDPLVPISRNGQHQSHIDRTVNFWRTANDCQNARVSRTLDWTRRDGTAINHHSYRNCPGGAVSYYQIIGGGHTWPGGLQIAPELLIGRTSREMNAGQVIVDFFQLND